MLIEEAIKYFGSKTQLASAAGVSQSAVSRWINLGFVPQGSAASLASVTMGGLAFDRSFYERKKAESMRKRKAKRNGKMTDENQSAN